jgi:hypothetical protein
MAESPFAESDRLFVASQILDALLALQEVGLAASVGIRIEIARTVIEERLDEVTACYLHTPFDALLLLTCHRQLTDRFFAVLSAPWR